MFACVPLAADEPATGSHRPCCKRQTWRARGRTLRGPVLTARGWRQPRVLGSWLVQTRPAVARIHRAMCRMEAAAYADVALVEKPFQPGVTPVPPSGKVIGANELEHLIEASLDGWLTTGRFNELFQQQLGKFIWAASMS